MNRLKILREEKGLTQAEVAQILEITSQAYGLLENGKRDISTEYLIKLSNYYNVTTDFIIGASDNRTISYDFNADLMKIGLSMKDYAPPTAEQKKQIEDFAKYVLKDNKKEK